MMDKIQDFLTDLSAYESTFTVYNPYDFRAPNAELCQANLKSYIEGMKQSGSNILIVGEAPGYNGCRLTGVPFTSEYILSEAFHLMSNIFSDNPFRTTGKQKESSATIVWNGFNDFGVYPIMWNAFPFHPHKERQEKTNRPPTHQELEVGKEYLRKYIDLFDRDLSIWAIGKKAKDALTSINIEAEYIRHPSMGGKNDFLSGLRLIKSLEV